MGDSRDLTSSPAHLHINLILPNTVEKKLSNEIKHISLALLVAELWTPKVGEHFSKHYLKYKRFPIEMSSKYPFYPLYPL